MDLKNVITLINEVEKRYPVDQWIINNVHIWPIIRIQLATELQFIDENNNVFSDTGRNSFFSKIVNSLNEIAGCIFAKCKDYKNNDNIKQNIDALFVTTNCARTFKTEEGYYDIFCDPCIDYFSDSLKRRTLTLEIADNIYRLPRRGKSIFIQKDIEIIKIKSYLQKKIFCKEEIMKLPQFNSFLNFISTSMYNIIVPNVNKISTQVFFIRNMANYFKNVLTITQPKVVFMVCYYDFIKMALNLACREMNINSVDIQHGVQGDMHAAYAAWTKVPSSGYELMPKNFWCWSSHEKQTIDKWNYQCAGWHKSLVCGNIWIKMWKGNCTNKIVKYYDDEVRHNQVEGKNINILYTMQTGQEIPGKIIEAINSSPSNWQWWIRLHPSMFKDTKNIKYKLQANIHSNNYIIDAATELPLPALLRHMNVHVTEFSSVIIEADLLGVPSVSVNKWATELFPEQSSSGMLLLAEDSQTLIEAIQLQMEQKSNSLLREETLHYKDIINSFIK